MVAKIHAPSHRTGEHVMGQMSPTLVIVLGSLAVLFAVLNLVQVIRRQKPQKTDICEVNFNRDIKDLPSGRYELQRIMLLLPSGSLFTGGRVIFDTNGFAMVVLGQNGNLFFRQLTVPDDVIGDLPLQDSVTVEIVHGPSDVKMKRVK